MAMFCARIACCGSLLELTISPIQVHTWKAREKTALMRDALNTARMRLAAQRIFFSISRVIGHLTLGVDAFVPAESTTFLKQNFAAGSSLSASLCLWLRADTYVPIVALAWPTESIYAMNMASLSGVSGRVPCTPFRSFTCWVAQWSLPKWVPCRHVSLLLICVELRKAYLDIRSDCSSDSHWLSSWGELIHGIWLAIVPYFLLLAEQLSKAYA